MNEIVITLINYDGLSYFCELTKEVTTKIFDKNILEKNFLRDFYNIIITSHQQRKVMQNTLATITAQYVRIKN